MLVTNTKNADGLRCLLTIGPDYLQLSLLRKVTAG